MGRFKVDYTRVLPSIYKNSTSFLVTKWDVRMKSLADCEYLSPAIMHSIEYTLSSYLIKKYGRHRVLGVFIMGDRTGIQILTRFIDRSMIFDSVVDYIMDIQRMHKISTPDTQYEIHDLIGAKKELLSYYDRVLRYQNSAINY